jgi:hypothetical protein
VPRRLRLTERYTRAVARLGVGGGTVRGAALGRTLRALLSADELPSPVDTTAAVPPTGSAYVRRVAGHNVWLWYLVRGEELVLLTVTSEPPVPLD